MTDTCQATIGLNHPAIPSRMSLAGSWGCTEPATVTLRAGCVHEHVKQKRFCAVHGQPQPGIAVWLCLECAEAGHDCALVPVVVTEAEMPS